MKPLMLKEEILALERALLSIRSRPVSVLEWGSGGSTVYFTQFLRTHGISYDWTSVEYNKGWAEKVSAELKGDTDTHLVLFDVGNDEILQPDIPMNEYVGYPKTLGKKFDLILVDGRKRRRCVLEARDLVTENGFVFLHDAQRGYYHDAFKAYPRHRFLSGRLWEGRTGAPSAWEACVDFFRTLSSQTVFAVHRALWKAYAASLRPFVKKFFA